MKLIPLPAFTDNYIWMLHDGHQALVVDPGDAQPVLDALQREGLQLESILVTHHHADHTGGVAELQKTTGAQVCGPATENIPGPLQGLSGGDRYSSLGLVFQVLDVPGHTAGHIAFYCDAVDGVPLLFCGDTLFSGGCGRLFEGTPAQMLASLDSLAALPDNTRVCCTHEYTLSNLKFATAVEPDNTDLQQYRAQCEALRAKGLPTLPSNMALERKINPFLRSRMPAVVASATAHDAALTRNSGAFACLRQWKNDYR
ncbi:hydroxyacylglutathione hydrolase [Rhodoferax lacus]|uniref:Hydroxyacylglutathione hydrolase n=1 Tax=Rhodoferax lacus TaxID=2184758 RepID=A0A3E1RC96_9BURK|nr:hydroxyacylglutathione hydrolase [Rhodoferax lacus]RFO96987.1 hydroxyacylglutathione hydrolase [Rhodoferax lacus]